MNMWTQVLKRLGGLRLGQRLYGAFALTLILTAAMGGQSLYGLQRVNAEAKALSEKWLQGVGSLATIRAALLETRDFEVKHSRTDDKSYHAEYEDKMTAAMGTLSTALASYQQRIEGPVEHSAFEAFANAWKAYDDARKRIVQLGRSGKQEDAAEISDGVGSMSADEALSALDTLTRFNFDGANRAAAEAAVSYVQVRTLTGVLLAVVLTVSALAAVWLTRSITVPLMQASRLANRVAQGDLTSHIAHVSTDETGQLLDALMSMQRSLTRTVLEVRQNAESVAEVSSQIAQGNNDLSGRTERQAMALEKTAASVEELSATVRQNADNATQANELARGASTVATHGGTVVSQVVNTMQGINDSSKKIADIIGVIDGIAFQTNILALNAAVEAARAGEQGRGFAVVASEVRSLAQRSAEAAKEIKGLISASVDRVEQGSTLVNQAGATMTEVVASIRRVTDIMGEISVASHEQSLGVAQVGDALTQMDQATQQNAALVEESAAVADSLKTQARSLVDTVAVFTLSAAA